MRFWGLVILIVGLVLITPRAKAQIVSVPIPGSPLTLNVQANPQPLQNLNQNPSATSYNLGDDGWANVPLPFSFPFYGQNFNMSTMYSNGAVQFGQPVPVGAWPNWNNAFCCSGQPLNSGLNPGYNYSIMPLWTDLMGLNGNQHYTLGTNTTMTYGWYDVVQYGQNNNKSSFELKIDSTGGIDMRWSGAVVSYTPVTIGTVGDASLGQYTQNYHGNGINIGPTQLTTGIDLCVINPLSSPSCTGYAEAYKTQQCSISPLYDPSCPGYSQAYYTQQCTLNDLYDSGCPGYQEAYLTQQCTANPLYSVNCPGYQQTYFNQQCSLSALYSPNCPGYEQANFNLQCSLNPLYNSACPGYQQAYFDQQCTANPLYNSACPGYQQAYFNQQCSLNTLYNSSCPGYTEAYKAYLTAQACQANPQSSTTCPGYVTPTVSAASTTTTISATPSATPQVIADPVVNRAVTTTSTTATPTAPAAPVQLVPSNTQQTTTALVVESVQSQSTSSSSSTSSTASSTSTSSTTASSSTQSNTTSTSTARQSIQQARVEAARKQAIAKGSEAVKESGEARSIDAQVATQGLVIAAMGFNPGFDAYNSVVMRDASFYKPFSIYTGQHNVDNRSAGRALFGATDQLHLRMVDQQYKLGN
jgi:hypothetical protein